MLEFFSESRADEEYEVKIRGHTKRMEGESIMIDLYSHKRRIAVHEANSAADRADEAAVEQQVLQIRTLFADYRQLDAELRTAGPLRAVRLNADCTEVSKQHFKTH